jgi:apolipoprotein N-acyltransferase
MIVAASSGVSQIINAEGRAVAALGALQTGCLNGTLERRNDLGFYTRHGWLSPWAALSALLVWTVWLIRVNPRC